MEIITPIARTNANPRIIPVPNEYKIMQVIKVDTFESRIDVHACEKPSSIAVRFP